MCLKFIYTSNTKICWNINPNFHQGDFWRFHITLKVSYNFTTMDILADLKRKKKNGKKTPTNQPRFICPFCLGRSNNICNLSSGLKWGFDELPERWAEDQSQLLSSDPAHQSHGSIPEKVSCYPVAPPFRGNSSVTNTGNLHICKRKHLKDKSMGSQRILLKTTVLPVLFFLTICLCLHPFHQCFWPVFSLQGYRQWQYCLFQNYSPSAQDITEWL